MRHVLHQSSFAFEKKRYLPRRQSQNLKFINFEFIVNSKIVLVIGFTIICSYIFSQFSDTNTKSKYKFIEFILAPLRTHVKKTKLNAKQKGTKYTEVFNDLFIVNS